MPTSIADKILAQNISMGVQYVADLHNLMAVLGVSDVTKVANGTAVNIYKTGGTLNTTQVAAGAEINASAYGVGSPTAVTVTFEKYRKITPIEDIATYGYELAAERTDRAMLTDIQKRFRGTIYTGLATGTGTATGTGFQAAVANAWAALDTAFEDEAMTGVYFANPLDVAGYLGAANITMQTAYGMSYIQNFMGLGNVIVDSNVTSGKIYATAAENLGIFAADVAGIEGLDLTTDESGIFAVHHGAKYDHGALETVVYAGVKVLPTFADRVIKATISQ